MRTKDRYDIAIVGATGAVGREMLEILDERGFRISRLVLLASEDSAGEQLTFGDRLVRVERLEEGSFAGLDLAFFFGSGEQTTSHAPAAVKAGAVVIDGSGILSGDTAVPLVVPEVNGDSIARHQGIIASPNSSTINMVMVLKPLHDAVRIKRAVVTTFQSVSGSGKRAMDELAGQTVALMNFKDLPREVFPHQIAFNCLPQTEAFQENGYTREEELIAHETRKVLGAETLTVTVTAVRVPVFRGYAATLNIETEKAIDPNEARALLAALPGVAVYDDPGRGLYPMPIEASGRDEVFVGRIRCDDSIPHGLNCWVVSDNLRKGAALNAVQIAERLIV